MGETFPVRFWCIRKTDSCILWSHIPRLGFCFRKQYLHFPSFSPKCAYTPIREKRIAGIREIGIPSRFILKKGDSHREMTEGITNFSVSIQVFLRIRSVNDVYYALHIVNRYVVLFFSKTDFPRRIPRIIFLFLSEFYFHLIFFIVWWFIYFFSSDWN